MGFSELFHFYRKSSEYLTPEEAAIAQAAEAGERHATYHTRIVFVSCTFGLIGVGLGLVFAIGMAARGAQAKDAQGLLLAPFMSGAVGVLFGATLACLFAPRAFLTGPVGKKWMKLIGTESVLAARIVCLLFGLMIMTPIVGIGLLLALSK